MRALLVFAFLAASPAFAAVPDKTWLERDPLAVFANVMVLVGKCEAAQPYTYDRYRVGGLLKLIKSGGYDDNDVADYMRAAESENYMTSSKRACEEALERYGPHGTVFENAIVPK